MESELTGRTANLMLNAALGDPMTTAIYEGLCAGNAQSVVRGVAVFMRRQLTCCGARQRSTRT